MSTRNITEDAKILLGLPPHNTFSNFCQGDGYFAKDCERIHGEAAFSAECERLLLAARGRPRDPNVECRAMLAEVLKVLQCHHRNSHKPLIDRVRKFRDTL